jgi:hypothetical protein
VTVAYLSFTQGEVAVPARWLGVLACVSFNDEKDSPLTRYLTAEFERALGADAYQKIVASSQASDFDGIMEQVWQIYGV